VSARSDGAEESDGVAIVPVDDREIELAAALEPDLQGMINVMPDQYLCAGGFECFGHEFFKFRIVSKQESEMDIHCFFKVELDLVLITLSERRDCSLQRLRITDHFLRGFALAIFAKQKPIAAGRRPHSHARLF
jgi:hypothetical protein